jgi:hypothetical protein
MSAIARAPRRVLRVGILLTVMLAGGSSWREARGGGPPTPARDHQQLEDVEKTLGPFRMDGRDYTVVLREKRRSGALTSDPDAAALAWLEIRDRSGTVLHHERFDYSADERGFESSCSASVQLLKGSMNSALLIDAGCLPSAPESGGTWQVFGVWSGKFMRLGRPFTTQGQMIRFVPGLVTKIGKATSFQPDVIELRTWTRNFHVTVPLTLNWIQGQLVPPRCFEQTEHGMLEGSCELKVEVEPTPVEDELTFVRLFTEADERFGTPKHVVVKRDSKVEFLGARVRVVPSSGTVLEIGVADDPWLHVRIDGLEGWLHTQEDFAAIGVPEAG